MLGYFLLIKNKFATKQNKNKQMLLDPQIQISPRRHIVYSGITLFSIRKTMAQP